MQLPKELESTMRSGLEVERIEKRVGILHNSYANNISHYSLLVVQHGFDGEGPYTLYGSDLRL